MLKGEVELVGRDRLQRREARFRAEHEVVAGHRARPVLHQIGRVRPAVEVRPQDRDEVAQQAEVRARHAPRIAEAHERLVVQAEAEVEARQPVVIARRVAVGAAATAGKGRHRRRDEAHRVDHPARGQRAAAGDIIVEGGGERIADAAVRRDLGAHEAQADIAANVEPADVHAVPAEAEHRIGGLGLLLDVHHLGREVAALDRGIGAVADRLPAHRRIRGRAADALHQPGPIHQRGAVHIDQRRIVVDAAIVEAVAKSDRLPHARAIALEGRVTRVAARIGTAGGVVDVETRAVAVPRSGDRAPVEGGIADRLAAIGIAHADLQRVEPAALVEIIGDIAAERSFLGVIMLHVRLDERHPVIVRVGEAASGIVDVRARQQLHLRGAVAVRAVLHVGHRADRDEDVVIGRVRPDVLHVEIDVQLLGRVPADVARQVLGSLAVIEVAGLVLEIEAVLQRRADRRRGAIVDEGQARHGRAGVDRFLGAVPAPAPAAMRLGERARAEHAVRPEDEGRSAWRGAEERAGARKEGRLAIGVALEDHMAGPLEPGIVIFAVIVLRGHPEIAGIVLILRRRRDAAADAIIVDLRIADAVGDIGPARAAERVRGAGDRAVGIDDAAARRIGRAGGAEGVDLVHDHAFRARDDMAAGEVGEQAEAADRSVPGVRDQARELAGPLLGAAAIGRLGIAGDDEALLVERQAGPQVDRAGQAALDHLRRLVLIGVDARHQLGRHVVEVEAAIAVGREAVAPVEFGAHEGEAADQHAGGLARGVRGVVGRLQARGSDARHALKRARHRSVREGADIGRSDRIDHRVRIALDRLRGLERLADADDDDRGRIIVFLGRFGCAGRCLGGLRLGDAGKPHQGHGGKRGAAPQDGGLLHLSSLRRSFAELLHARRPGAPAPWRRVNSLVGAWKCDRAKCARGNARRCCA